MRKRPNQPITTGVGLGERRSRKPGRHENPCPVRNRIDCMDAVDGLRALPDACIPLTVSSPPYDSIRSYGGHIWDHETFMLIARELWRVTVPGGVVCWVVQDQIVGGGLTGTSFRQALYFLGLGYSLHNVLIIEKQVSRGIARNRYGVAPEFVFVLTKGRPRAANILRDKPNKYAGQMMRFSTRSRDGAISETKKVLIRPFGVRPHIWRYASGSRTTAKEPYAYGHPSLMGERLAHDLIVSWSRPLDLVLDPLAGAATTCKMALLSDRYYLGYEVHEPYHGIAQRRMADAHRAYREHLLDNRTT